MQPMTLAVPKPSLARRLLVVLALAAMALVGVAPQASANGYPDADAVACGGQYEWCKGGSAISSRGYYYRNCTDYVAWRLVSAGAPLNKVQGLGNAKNWTSATSKGITVNATPAAGSVAIQTTGTYGHVAYVESVSGSNITVSDYNGIGTGQYRHYTVAASTFQYYAHYEALTGAPGGGTSTGQLRIGVLSTQGELSIKEGPLNAVWSQIGGGTSFKMSPNRIAVLGANGVLAVKEGPLNATWTEVTSGVSSFDVTDTRVGVMYPNGTLHVKQGSLGATWSHIGDGASFKMSPNRIAVLSSSGALSVKEGPLNATWVAVASGVSAFEVTDNRIGIRNGSGQISIKEGPLNTGWVHVTDGASFKMSPNRIAVLSSSGALSVKEGPLGATWVTVSTGVGSFDVTDSRIVIRSTSGTVSVKEGSLGATWSQISNGGATAVELN